LNKAKIFSEIKQHIIQFSKGHKYFPLSDLRSYLTEKGISYSENTIVQYLSELTNSGHIFSAGRGWYSSIEEVFPLETHSVKNFIQFVTELFPLLEFSVWSTKQVRGYSYHIPTKFVTFLYTAKDHLPSVADVLQDSEYDIYLNPYQIEVHKGFRAGDKTVVLRPELSESPENGKYAPIEKILVDLVVENDKLPLLGYTDVSHIFHDIVSRYRINIAKLVRYARRRRVLDHKIFRKNIPMAQYTENANTI